MTIGMQHLVCTGDCNGRGQAAGAIAPKCRYFVIRQRMGEERALRITRCKAQGPKERSTILRKAQHTCGRNPIDVQPDRRTSVSPQQGLVLPERG